MSLIYYANDQISKKDSHSGLHRWLISFKQ